MPQGGQSRAIYGAVVAALEARSAVYAAEARPGNLLATRVAAAESPLVAGKRVARRPHLPESHLLKSAWDARSLPAWAHIARRGVPVERTAAARLPVAAVVVRPANHGVAAR